MTAQFDMFSNAPDEPAFDPGRDVHRKSAVPAAMSETAMVRHLTGTGRYRVLRKLEPREIASVVRPQFPLKGVIIDTEATGLNHRKDEIIEIGLVAFTFDAQGTIGDITAVYGGLNQPTIPVPAEITKLTGITDDMLEGQVIDMQRVRSLVDPADLIIAHNAGFDRPFCEAFSPAFAKKAWACSNAEVDWRSRGYEGSKLGYLIGQSGYFHDGHRAVDDCFALLEVLAREAEGVEITAFAELYHASQRSRFRVLAENSPFDMKDVLKARGYRWSDGSDGRVKSWWTEVGEGALDEELRFLRTEIYRYQDADPPTQRLTAFDRFKA